MSRSILLESFVNTDGLRELKMLDRDFQDPIDPNDFTADNQILRSDTASGPQDIQGSTVTLSDTGVMTAVQEVNLLADPLFNVKYGFETLAAATTLDQSVAIGHQAAKSADGFGMSVVIGHRCCRDATEIAQVVAIGDDVLLLADAPTDIVAIGDNVLELATTGNINKSTAIGHNALRELTAGENNVSVGSSSGQNLATGTDNTFLGTDAGIDYTTTESNNICIGSRGVVLDNQKIRIGSAQTNTFIQGIHNVTPAGATQNVVVDANGELGSSTQLSSSFVATEDDNFAVTIDCDAAGFADIKALDIVYKSGALNGGDVNAASLVLLDDEKAVGGRLFGNAVLSTDIGAADTHALGVGISVHPVYQQSGGGFTEMETHLNNGVSATSDLNDVGTLVSVFVADNNTLTHSSGPDRFSALVVTVTTPSSGGGVAPTFEYSTGVGTWAFFTPADGTNGYRNTGVILWDINDISGWGLDLNNEFAIRVTRTRNMLTTTPIVDFVHMAENTTLYGWDRNGDVTVNSVNVLECNLQETGGGTDIITIQAPAAISNYTLTLPVDDGNADEVLTTNGSGVLTWGAGGLAPGYLSGFEQVNATTTTITFGTASETSTCRDVDDTFDIVWSGLVTLTITDTNVAGGYQDSGGNPVGGDQPLQIYAIADSTGVNAPNVLCSGVGEDITTLPLFTGGSYDKLRRIGWARTLDGAATLIPHMVGGKGRSRNFHFTGGRANQTVLFAGSATTWTDMTDGGNGTDTYTAPGSHHMICRTAFGSSASANDEVVFRQNGSTLAATDAEYTFSSGSSLAAGELADGQLLIHLGGDRITEYEVSAAANDAYVYVISCSFGI